MKELKLIDRVVVEIYGDGDMPLYDLANKLHLIADQIEDGIIGNSETEEGVELLWEHECQTIGFKIGERSLIRDAYYGAKEFFDVCALSKEDIEKAGFDARKLDAYDMERIASRQGELIRDCCDYWTALEGACEYWELPRKDSIRAHLYDILVDDETDTGGTSFHNQTLRELLEEIQSTLNEKNITLDDDVSVLDDILKECGIKPIVKNNDDIREVIP